MTTGTPFDLLPRDMRVFRLRKRSKLPATAHAHHNALPLDDFVYFGGNYGIALDGQFLVVDIDAGDPDWLAQLPPTWAQRTPGGVHRLFRTPSGFRGWNHKIKIGTNGSTRILGDIKVKGYIVGPGSEVDADRGRPAGVYELLDARDPAPAPEWLLAMAAATPENVSEDKHAPTSGIQEFDRVLVGENRTRLLEYAGWLWDKGYTQAFIVDALEAFVNSGRVEQLPEDPWTRTHFESIAKSASQWARRGRQDDLTIALPTWLSGEAFMPPARGVITWVLHGYVQRGALTTMFGEGGIGKTTWAAWLAAQETLRKKRFGLIATEDSPDRFLAQVVAHGGDPNYLIRPAKPMEIRLPISVPMLEEAIITQSIDTLFFDSLYGHFTFKDGENLAERARRALEPLADLAQRTGCAILGNLHQNKAGEYLGSVEVRNISRAMLHFKRGRGEDKPLTVSLEKTNYKDNGRVLKYSIGSAPFVNPFTGEAQMEENEAGVREVSQVGIVTDYRATVRAPKGTIDIDDLSERLPGE